MATGTNKVVGSDPKRIVSAAFAALDKESETTCRIPPLWDGHTAERIVEALS